MNFTEDINRLKQTEKQLAFVKDFLDEHLGAELYLVGGAVRDLVIGRLTPPIIPPRGVGRDDSIDFDFVVRGLDPQALEQWFSARGEINLVGKTFGVFRFMPEGMDATRARYIDIALPRTEQANADTKGGYREFAVQSDANLPIEDDLARRDFTMNAMAIDMRTGELIDPYDGQGDIKQKIIRAVGDPDERFNEDLSRILRAIRFASELHFEIEEKTLEAIRENVGRMNDMHENPPLSPLEKGGEALGEAGYLPLPKGEYEGVSAQRFVVSRETIGSELAKALAADPAGAVKWLVETGAMETIIQKAGSWNPAYADVSRVQPGNPTLAVALLLQSNDRDDISNILTMSGLDSLPRESRLRIEPETILWLVNRLCEEWNEATVGALRASIFEKYFMNGRASLLLQALELTGKTAAADVAKNRARAIRDRWGVDDDEPIPPLISGNDVIASGIPAGPRVRETLESLRDEQLDGRVLTREQAKAWLK